MERAWGEVRQNRGAAGVDGVSIDDHEASGAGEFLARLAAALRAGRYRPRPLRRARIPKPGGRGETRPLGIATVADWVVMAAARIVLEPILEAGFLPFELRVSAPALGPPRQGDRQADGHLPGQAVGARRRHPKLL